MTVSMREAWGRTLVELGAEDPRLVVLDADLATSTQAVRFAEAFADRFFEIGIDEQNMVGVAAGIATTGAVPWVSSFGVFLSHRALDPLRVLVAQCHANVKVAAAYTGVCFGMAGKTHHDHADVAIVRSMPGMVLLSPGDAAEAAEATRWAQRYDGPVYLRLARNAGDDLPPGPLGRPGSLRVLRDGRGPVLVSTGGQTARVLAAAGLLAEQGVDARVVHAPWLKPFDAEGLVELCADAPFVVTVEEHEVAGGLGGMVAEVLSSSATPRRVHRIGLEDVWVETGPDDWVLDTYGLSARAVARRVAGLAGGSARHVP